MSGWPPAPIIAQIIVMLATWAVWIAMLAVLIFR